jgi:CubicO group peptidase (beta-lactamase class C family)
MKFNRAIVPILLLYAFTTNAVAQYEKVDALFNEQIAKKASPSYSVAIVKSGKVVYAKGYGLADIENEVPATPESVYRLGSITKQFTATIIMQLIQESKLKLDDTCRSILPEVPLAWEKVTVRQLLNHTSGIKSYTEVKGIFMNDAMKPTTPAGIIKTVENEPLDFEPGTKWHYNNTGYELLGMIIEKLDTRPFGDSLKARILDPLGMKNTFFTSERTIVKHRVHGYTGDKDGFKNAHYLNMDWPYAAGSMESTVLDLAKWDAALYGDKILPQKALAEMWTSTSLGKDQVANYGFGWNVAKINGIQVVEHGGGIHGFSTFIRRIPSKNLTIIVLCNNDDGNASSVAVQTSEIVETSIKANAEKVIVDPDPTISKFTREFLQEVLDGKLNRTKLTPEFSSQISPEMEKGVKEQLGSLGAVTKFELIANKTNGKSVQRTYRIALGETLFKMDIAIDDKGLVAGFGIHK